MGLRLRPGLTAARTSERAANQLRAEELRSAAAAAAVLSAERRVVGFADAIDLGGTARAQALLGGLAGPVLSVRGIDVLTRSRLLRPGLLVGLGDRISLPGAGARSGSASWRAAGVAATGPALIQPRVVAYERSAPGGTAAITVATWPTLLPFVVGGLIATGLILFLL